MWALLVEVFEPIVYYAAVPVGMVVGAIGVYTVEKYRKETPFKEKTIMEEREERKLRELEEHDAADVARLRSKNDIPRTVLDRNDEECEHMKSAMFK